MVFENIFQNVESVLDDLIQNASCLNQTPSEEKEAIHHLQEKQNALLEALITLDHRVNDDLKYETFKKDPTLYTSLNEKMLNLSQLNKSNLRPPKERWIKPARVHRNRRAATS